MLKYKEFIQSENNVNEGFRTWLATFMLLLNLGLVPKNVYSSDMNTKKDFVDNLSSTDIVAANFLKYVNDNDLELSMETFNDFKNSISDNTINYKDVKRSMDKLKTSVGSIDYDDIMNIKPINFVSDYADLIDDNIEYDFNKLLSDYEDSTDVEIAVLTIKNTQGYDISDYSQRIGQKWGVGKKGYDNGLIITISVEDRKWNISTGYGLEYVLPDAMCKRLGEKNIPPNFKNGEYEKGIRELIDDIMEEIGSENIEFKKERMSKEREEFKANTMKFLTYSMEILLMIFLSYGVYYLVNRRKRKLLELTEEINDYIEKAEKMGIILEKINKSNLTSFGNSINTLKNKLKDIETTNISKSRLNEISKLMPEIIKEYNEYIKLYNRIEKVSINMSRMLENMKLFDDTDVEYIMKLKYQIKEFLENTKVLNISPNQLSKIESKYNRTYKIYDLYKNSMDVYKSINKLIPEKGVMIEKFRHDFKKSLSILSDIENNGYKYPIGYNEDDLDKIFSLLDDMTNTYKEDFLSILDKYKNFVSMSNDIKNKNSKIVNYKKSLDDIKEYVDKFKIEGLLNDYDNFKKIYGKNYNIEEEINDLKKLLSEDRRGKYFNISNKILNINKMMDDIIEERRKRIRREEEERRKRIRREEEERRSSSGSYSGFGGGSFGGGGASGSW